MSVHCRLIELEDITEETFSPATLRLRLFGAQADRFLLAVGTEGYLTVDITNRTIALDESSDTRNTDTTDTQSDKKTEDNKGTERRKKEVFDVKVVAFS